MPETNICSAWIMSKKPSDSASLNLICFAPGGCGASIFNGWTKYLDPSITVCAVQLPGRESRFNESPITVMSSLVSQLIEGMQSYIEPLPFAVFGHSVGALIGFEFVRQLCQNHQQIPQSLILSGRRAPHIPLDQMLHLYPDAELIEELRLIGGTPKAILDDSELMSLFLPIVRADFTLNETYSLPSNKYVDCPILAIGAVDDRFVSQSFIEQWQEYTTNEFEAVMLSGGHMSFKDDPQPLLNVITNKLLM